MSKSRFVVVGILALAVVVALPLAHGFQWTWIYMGWDDPPIFGRDLSLTRLVAYAIAAGAAIFALKHKRTRQLSDEVVDELTKVTWPSREETGHATLVVVVTVVICAAYLGVFDAVWLWVTDMILGVEPELTG